MFDDYQLTFHDYLAILRRRALVMILGFGVVLTAAVLVAFSLPRIYESTATILVEGPQVQVTTNENSASQSRPEERVNLIRQRLMTRENLVKFAEQHQLFTENGKRALSETDVVKAMRSSIQLDLVGGSAEPWAPRPKSISFNLSFQYGDPATALAVTRDLAAFFLDRNRRDRVDQASRTTEFLGTEAQRVRKELESLEARIAVVKSQQAGTSADNSAVTQGSLQSMEADLRIVQRDHRVAMSELRAVEVELAAARRGVMAPGAVTSSGPSQTEQELERARAQLAGLRAVYSESHPDVRSLERRIAGLEQAVAVEARAQTPSRTAARDQAELAVSRLNAQLEAARSRVELLADQQSTLRDSIGQLRGQSARAPQVEQQLAALQRDYDATKSKYEELRAQMMSAQVVESLEGGEQAERFTLLEPPLLPEYPVKPSRKKIVLAGVAAAAGAAAALALLLEMLQARVWGANAVAAVVKQRPMASIPYIETRAEVHAVEAWRQRLIYMVAMAVLLVLAFVHFWVMPLQDLLVLVSSRLN